MMRSVCLKIFIQQTFDRIVGPPPESDKGQKRFDLLDIDGITCPGERVEPGKVYVNKQTPTNTTDALANPENMPESGMKHSPNT